MTWSSPFSCTTSSIHPKPLSELSFLHTLNLLSPFPYLQPHGQSHTLTPWNAGLVLWPPNLPHHGQAVIQPQKYTIFYPPSPGCKDTGRAVIRGPRKKENGARMKEVIETNCFVAHLVSPQSCRSSVPHMQAEQWRQSRKVAPPGHQPGNSFVKSLPQLLLLGHKLHSRGWIGGLCLKPAL